MNNTLTYLEQIKHNLEYVDYEMIYQSIADLKDKFAPTALIKKGWFIDRVRINKPDEIFTNVEQISYIHDKEVLEKYVSFGRANEPKQAVFYGSILSPQIEHPRLVAYFETSELIKELPRDKDFEETFTVSRWTILEDIEVVEMIFSNEAIKVNEYNRLSLENQIKNYGNLPLAKHYEEQGKFFSNEFARADVKKDESYKYKITAAYANYIWRNTPLRGITYPSVPTSYLGQNVALLPEMVDKYLKLERVAIFKFKREKGHNVLGDCHKMTTEFGERGMDFQWHDYIQ